jgi:hypothetical protein
MRQEKARGRAVEVAEEEGEDAVVGAVAAVMVAEMALSNVTRVISSASSAMRKGTMQTVV